MKLKQLAIVTGTVAGLTLAAPSWVAAQAVQDGGAMDSQPGATQQDSYDQGMSSPGTASDMSQAGSTSDLMQMQVSELEGQQLVNQNGETLGKIQKIVQDKQDQSLHAVVAVGGFLGIGGKQVTIPVEQLQRKEDQIVATIGASQDELNQRTAYNEGDFSDLQGDQQLASAMGGAAAGMPQAEIASFEELDTNQDGYVSREEAISSEPLVNNWSSADTNADDQLDQSEFSAFEEQQGGATEPAPDTGMGTDGGMGTDTGGGTDSGAMGDPQSSADPMSGQAEGEIASFESLDTDGDGYISEQEAQAHDALANSWQDVDVNSDNQLDQAEFSAFESGLEAPSVPQEPGVDSGMEQTEPMSPGDTGSGVQ